MCDVYINDQGTQKPFPLSIYGKSYLKHFNSGYHHLGSRKEKYWERSGNHSNKELISSKNQLALKKKANQRKQTVKMKRYDRCVYFQGKRTLNQKGYAPSLKGERRLLDT